MRLKFPAIVGEALPGILFFTLLHCVASSARGDEGMWLFNHPPLQQLKQAYGFTPPPGWLDRLQRTCVRMEASGSIVSSNGLVMTNHHVGIDQLQKLSTAQRNLLHDGFLAATLDQELQCPGFEVQVLRSVEDVTGQITAAVPKGADPADAWTAMRREMSRVEAEQGKTTGLDCEVASLYQGARGAPGVRGPRRRAAADGPREDRGGPFRLAGRASPA